MARVPNDDDDGGWNDSPVPQATRSNLPLYAPHNEPALHLGKGGKTKRPRTVVECEMQLRGIRQGQVVGALRCSPRAWQNYVARRRPFPSVLLVALCELLEMDDDELVGNDGFLRLLHG